MTPGAGHATRLDRARRALDGLSVGDAFGEQFFLDDDVLDAVLAARRLPPPPWRCTDDTAMALSVLEALDGGDFIDPDRLLGLFVARYFEQPGRGYGATLRRLMEEFARGADWRVAAPRAHRDGGSMGNGSAMRVAPLGAYYADDLEAVVANARTSAEVTHAHPEGVAGAVATAVAAALAAQSVRDPDAFFATVLRQTPQGETRAGIERAAALSLDSSPAEAATLLGSGQRVTAPDTVPFCLWCTARHAGDYVEALWCTVAGLGDRDTTCAIVGGIVASDPGVSVPSAWLAAREPLESLAIVGSNGGG